MNFYKKYIAKSYSFLIIDATLASDNPLRFGKNLTKNIKPNHDIYDKIRDEKLQYNIKREPAKISALSSAKIDKYEYLTGQEILLSG